MQNFLNILNVVKNKKPLTLYVKGKELKWIEIISTILYKEYHIHIISKNELSKKEIIWI